MTNGLHEIPADEYHRIDRVSNSRLSWMARSPAFCRWNIDHPLTPTPAMRFGSACHYAILEPEKVEDTYLVAGACEAATKAGSPCTNSGTELIGGAWFCGIHAKSRRPDEPQPADPREVLSGDEWDRVRAVRDAVHAHPVARALLRQETRREVSMLWTDERTGLDCKGRIDIYAGETLGDCKITRDAHPHRIERFIANGTHRQAAMYFRGLRALGREASDFVVVAVEPEPPHEVAVYLLDPHAIRTGEEHVRRLLKQYAECVASGSWPGYGRDLQTISVPVWAQREMFPEEYGG